MKNCKEIKIRNKINLIYICLFFNIGYNIFLYLVYIINSKSEIVKNQFQAQFNFILSKSLEVVENNNEGTKMFIIYKCFQAITNTKKRVI